METIRVAFDWNGTLNPCKPEAANAVAYLAHFSPTNLDAEIRLGIMTASEGAGYLRGVRDDANRQYRGVFPEIFSSGSRGKGEACSRHNIDVIVDTEPGPLLDCPTYGVHGIVIGDLGEAGPLLNHTGMLHEVDEWRNLPERFDQVAMEILREREDPTSNISKQYALPA